MQQHHMTTRWCMAIVAGAAVGMPLIREYHKAQEAWSDP
jgi:hypothetical protein